MTETRTLLRRAFEGMIAARERSTQRTIALYLGTDYGRRWRDQADGK